MERKIVFTAFVVSILLPNLAFALGATNGSYVLTAVRHRSLSPMQRQESEASRVIFLST